MVMEYLLGQTAIAIKDNIKMVRSMVKDNTHMLMVVVIKENILMVRGMGKEHLFILMVVAMKVITLMVSTH